MIEFFIIHILGGIPYEVIQPFFAEIIAVFTWVYNMAVSALVAIGFNATVAKIIVDAAIAYGLYKLGSQDPVQSSLDARKLFTLRPNPPRMVVYGKCWLAPTIVSQTSDPNALHIICAVADHKLKALEDVRVQHQNFLTVEERDHLIKNNWGLYLSSENGHVSPARKAIDDANHERYHETENHFSYHPFLFMTYGFNGENMGERLGDFKNRTVRDPGRGFYNTNDFLPIKAGPGYGTDVSNYNMRMDGVSWTTISLKRLGKNLRPMWPFFPNFSYKVVRGNENLNVQFLWPRVEMGIGLGDFNKESTKKIKRKYWEAHNISDPFSSGHPLSSIESLDPEANLKKEIPDSEEILKIKDELYKNIVSEYYTEGNAALCTADFLKNYTSYREPVCGESRIDIESTLQAAKDCEEYRDANGDISPLTANGAMQIQRPDSVLQQLTMAMNAGSITESGGIRYMYVGKAATKKITITDDDIIVNPDTGTAATVMAMTSDISKRASAMDLRFLNEDDKPEVIGINYKSPTGRRIKRATNIGMQFAFINNAAQARQVGRLILDRQWNGAAISFVLLNSRKTPKPYDVLNMQIDNMRLMPSKDFRVLSVTNSLDGKVNVQAVHERPGLYDASVIGDYAPVPEPDYSLDPVTLGWDSDEGPRTAGYKDPAVRPEPTGGWIGEGAGLDTILTRPTTSRAGFTEIDAETGEEIGAGSSRLGNPVRIN